MKKAATLFVASILASAAPGFAAETQRNADKPSLNADAESPPMLELEIYKFTTNGDGLAGIQWPSTR